MIILAFTLPKAYELKKDEVDRFAAQAHHHTKVSYEYSQVILLNENTGSMSGSAEPGLFSNSGGALQVGIIRRMVPVLFLAHISPCVILLNLPTTRFSTIARVMVVHYSL